MERIAIGLVVFLLLAGAPAGNGRAAERGASGTAKSPATPKKKKAPKKKNGWAGKLKVGVNGSVVYNRHVPGVEDGVAVSLGLVLEGELRYTRGPHRWESRLRAAYAQSKPANVKAFVKSADAFDLRSQYLYSFPKLPQLHFFTGLHLLAVLFPGEIARDKDTTVLIRLRNGQVGMGRLLKNKVHHLTPAFSPTSFRQLAGIGAVPFREKLATLDLKLSLVGQQVWASGAAVDDVPSTSVLELFELEGYQQLGLQLEVAIRGQVKQRIEYAIHFELMYPLYSTLTRGLEGFDLLSIDLGVRLSLRLAKWASLDYVLSARRVPLLVDRWQIANNLVLSVDIAVEWAKKAGKAKDQASAK